MTASDAEFLDDLDRREHSQILAPWETLRLWKLCEYPIRNASERAHLIYGDVRYHTTMARLTIANRIAERLDS